MHYEMPTVLRMRVFLACKLSFRLLWLNSGTVRRGQMPHNACKGHWEFRLATGNAGTWMYQRGTIEQGCEFVPVAR